MEWPTSTVAYLTRERIARAAKSTGNQVDQVTELSFGPDTKHSRKRSKFRRIENLEENVPNLVRLTISDHQVERIENLSRLKFLTYLDLSGNKISSLDGIGLLTSLTSLNVSGNEIIRIPNQVKLLHCLNTFRIACNQLCELRDVCSLRKLPALHSLDISNNPITTLPHTREYVVFTTPSLEILNGESVNAKQRLQAHKRFDSVAVDSLATKLKKREADLEQIKDQLSKRLYLEGQMASELDEVHCELAKSETQVRNLHLELQAKDQILSSNTKQLVQLASEVLELRQHILFNQIDAGEPTNIYSTKMKQEQCDELHLDLQHCQAKVGQFRSQLQELDAREEEVELHTSTVEEAMKATEVEQRLVAEATSELNSALGSLDVTPSSRATAGSRQSSNLVGGDLVSDTPRRSAFVRHEHNSHSSLQEASMTLDAADELDARVRDLEKSVEILQAETASLKRQIMLCRSDSSDSDTSYVFGKRDELTISLVRTSAKLCRKCIQLAAMVASLTRKRQLAGSSTSVTGSSVPPGLARLRKRVESVLLLLQTSCSDHTVARDGLQVIRLNLVQLGNRIADRRAQLRRDTEHFLEIFETHAQRSPHHPVVQQVESERSPIGKRSNGKLFYPASISNSTNIAQSARNEVPIEHCSVEEYEANRFRKVRDDGLRKANEYGEDEKDNIRNSIQEEMYRSLEQHKQQIETELRVEFERELRVEFERELRVEFERELRVEFERELRAEFEREYQAKLEKNIAQAVESPKRSENETNEQTLKTKCDELERIISEKEQTLESMKLDMKKTYDEKRSMAQQCEKQLNDLRLEIETVQVKKHEQEELFATLQRQVHEAKQSLDALFCQDTELQDSIANLVALERKGEIAAEAVRQDVVKGQKEFRELMKDCDTMRQEKAELEKEIQETRGNMAQCTAEYNAMRERASEKRAKVKESILHLEVVSQRVTDAVSGGKEKEAEIKEHMQLLEKRLEHAKTMVELEMKKLNEDLQTKQLEVAGFTNNMNSNLSLATSVESQPLPAEAPQVVLHANDETKSNREKGIPVAQHSREQTQLPIDGLQQGEEGTGFNIANQTSEEYSNQQHEEQRTVAVETQMDQMQRTINRLGAEIVARQTNLESLKRDIVQVLDQKSQEERNLNELAEQVKKVTKDLATYESLLEEKQLECQREDRRVSDLESQFDQLGDMCTTVESKLEDCKLRLAETHSELLGKKHELTKVNEKLEEVNVSLQEHDQLLAQKMSRKKATEENLLALESRLGHLQSACGEQDEQHVISTRLTNDLQRASHQPQNQREKLTTELDKTAATQEVHVESSTRNDEYKDSSTGKQEYNSGSNASFTYLNADGFHNLLQLVRNFQDELKHILDNVMMLLEKAQVELSVETFERIRSSLDMATEFVESGLRGAFTTGVSPKLQNTKKDTEENIGNGSLHVNPSGDSLALDGIEPSGIKSIAERSAFYRVVTQRKVERESALLRELVITSKEQEEQQKHSNDFE